MYAEGRGVERDERLATHWLVSALSQGYSEAQEALDRLLRETLGLEDTGPDTADPTSLH